ncbi:unnamed protein product [Litomosoides sigmodontis]|uniref:Uncharacterized protein n=1 Tax=Litomosoides sigmodontis TaxID=42156 RepID=A0A3P6TH81_LITSI|nr:unnamed protein product [Litomosoides sigmodontis]
MFNEDLMSFRDMILSVAADTWTWSRKEAFELKQNSSIFALNEACNNFDETDVRDGGRRVGGSDSVSNLQLHHLCCAGN